MAIATQDPNGRWEGIEAVLATEHERSCRPQTITADFLSINCCKPQFFFQGCSLLSMWPTCCRSLENMQHTDEIRPSSILLIVMPPHHYCSWGLAPVPNSLLGVSVPGRQSTIRHGLWRGKHGLDVRGKTEQRGLGWRTWISGIFSKWGIWKNARRWVFSWLTNVDHDKIW